MKLLSYTYSTKLILLLLLTLTTVSIVPFGIMSSLRAASYSDSDSNTFVYYKEKLDSVLLDMEIEFRTNNSVSDATLSNIRSMVQEAYSRLPDRGDSQGQNEALKKSVDLYLDLVQKNKSSSSYVQNLKTQASRFLSEAAIEKITGSINANPISGNAPLTSSFLATAKDPSGINIPDNNFVWWMREAGGYKRELGRGPTFTYTFAKEGNYQIFLDVNSESRNKKGRSDVTPLSISQDITVKPRLGNIILLVNGVNVSNLDTLKVSPSLGKIGLLFDATASRAVSNGTIVKTKWDFGNGNILEYDGSPILERQLFVNPATYRVNLEITTNQGQSFQKQLQLLIRDPAAVIALDKETGYVGETLSMSARSYLANTTNIEYSWEIQDLESDTGKKIITSKVGNSFSYKFTKIGQYLVTLTTRSPNGNTDSDSRVIIIESRQPIINLDMPKPLTPERPNTLVFDASRSFDPDTNSAKGLIYEWKIDEEKVELDNISKEGAIGNFTFDKKGPHTVSLTVSNAYGKISTVDKKFDVTSTLTVGMNISPRAAPIGTMVSFQARSPKASFFEWNVGDGSPTINGTADFIQNTYKKTGIYQATLVVKNADGSEENRISRKIYITDTDKPFALIDVKNQNGSALEEAGACEQPEGAFIVNRAENTVIDGSNSINVDGNAAGISYTWKYMDRVKSGPSLSEKFTELGCFPIELTVRSEKTGASHSSTRYIEIKNIIPKVTSVDATIDGNKKDTQKIIVNVVANGARDEDGVITSYIWFYTTESDQEKQNIRITQSPSTTFVLPNVTEKYYFGVIVEDNDGARYDTSELISNQIPLLVANENANLNMPLISLNVSKTQVLTDDVVTFIASAKNIIGNDITPKSEFYWDFDGDGRIDQKTAEPQTTYTYKRSGKYNMKLKVINNGTSNTKYQVIYVKNELKAGAKGFRIGDMLYFMNTSNGTYDNVKWNFGTLESTSMYGTSIPSALISESGSLGSLTIKSGQTEISTIEITDSLIQNIEKSGSTLLFQSYPAVEGDTITIKSPGDKLLLSMHGNSGKEYIIDTDTRIDSDVDGIGDNDRDNKDSTSFQDGSVYLINNTAESRTRTREIKLSIIGDDGQPAGSKTIKVVFDFIKESSDNLPKDLSGSGGESFSATDRENLDKLQAKIRTLSPEDRIVFTQYYNNLIENWDDLHDRTEGLLLIQKEVIDTPSFDEATKTEFSNIIDIILVGDAQAVNEVSVASFVIEGLIDTNNPNRAYIIERLEQIKSHPGDLTQNKILGKEILEKIQDDTTISTENKLLIKTQLLTIVNGGQESIPEEQTQALAEESVSGNGILGFVVGVLKIFGIVIGIILLLFLIGYIAYRFSRKNNDTGFQDFLIDSIAHTKGSKPNVPKGPEIKKDPTITATENPNLLIPVIEKTEVRDPLESIGSGEIPAPGITPGEEKDNSLDPIKTDTVTPPVVQESHEIPEWLKPIGSKNLSIGTKDDSDSIVIKNPSSESGIFSGNSSEFQEEKTSSEDLIISPAILPQEEKNEENEVVLSQDVGTSDNENILPEEIKATKIDFSPGVEENAEIVGEAAVGEVSSPINDPMGELLSKSESTSDIFSESPQESPIIIDPLMMSEVHDASESNIDEKDSLIIPETVVEEKEIHPFIKENPAVSGDIPNAEEDLIPDWLRPSSPIISTPAEEEIIPETPSEQGLDIPKIITPPVDAELPDWLKNSIETPEKEINDEEKPSKPKKTAPLTHKAKRIPGGSSKEKKNIVPKKNPPSGQDDIPDWLR